MPNTSEGPITVFDNSVPAINLALSQILERLDSIKGLRGNPTIHAATSVGAPSEQEQAVRLQDLPTDNPAEELFWLLRGQAMGAGVAPTVLTDSTGGTASSTLAAVGGITALTDNTGGTANDTLTALGGIAALTDNSGGTANDTVQALTDPADTPLTADDLRDDLVANLIPELRNNYADLAAKVNALIADMNDARDNCADLGAKVNALIADMNDVRNALATLASFNNTLLVAMKAAGVAL